MNKIYKVMYSKVKQCAVVVSEIAKSHGHNGESSSVRKHAALMAAVLIALGSLSFTTGFMPMTAEAAITTTKTDGADFVGVERTDGLIEDNYANHKGHGAHGDDSITVGLKAIGGDGTITIGDRRAEKSLGSVYVGRGPGMPTGKVLPDKTDDGYWATSVGYQSDATGYGSIAIGSNATANNSYDKDSTGHGITLRTTSGDGKTVVLNGKPDIQRASVAIGYGASADNGNIAIGSYSDASTDLRTATTTDGKEIKSYLTDTKADSYVSVGKTDALRRISNVADGAADSDVATIRQLKALSDKAGVYNEGWGIKIADEKDDNDKVTRKNVISLNRNLGTNSGNIKSQENGKVFNGKVSFEAKGKNSLILGGEASTTYDTNVTAGTYGDYSVLVGGYNNSIKSEGKRAVVAAGSYNKASGENSAVIGGSYNQASGDSSVVIGGGEFSFDQGNQASGQFSTIIGGDGNKAQGINDVVSGGYRNVTSGDSSFIGGGQSNKALGYATAILGGTYNMGVDDTTVVGGQLNLALSMGVFAAGGSANQVAGLLSTSIGGQNQRVIGNFSTAIGGASTGINAQYATAIGSHAVVTSPNGLALGFKATADKEGTISFGHDKGDISGYDSKIVSGPYGYYSGEVKSYLVPPASGEDVRSVIYTPTYYDSAEYNRLVKVAGGKDAHDAVVMEQLKPYTKSDASNIGAHLKTYTVGEDGETITEADATPEKQKENKDDWGQALGAAPFTAGTIDAATNASTSDQLVAGKTLYDYDKPTDSQNYVKVNNTTGQNLSALDAQVKANAVTLNDKTHNIKYYSVEDKISDDKLLPSISGYSNEKNDGAKGAGSMAAGFNTHADGIASTVAGSYSVVVGTGLQGATALSYGTFNFNQNTDVTKEHSGVANSIIGQANATIDSNAAIIYGAGNTVTNSYRAIDTSKFDLSKVKQDIAKKDAAAVAKDLQEAVPTSGGQVMVMGGGNVVDNAYMSQVTGVGNTVKGNQVYAKNAKTGKWEWTTDTNKDTAIKGYDKDKSSQYNYVDGFNNEVINGKHDYVIGANNTVTGDSYDDKDAKKYSNESNIIFGDNHTVTNTKNAVIIGSSDTQMTLDKGDNATAIGHNASAQRDALAVGVNTQARGNAVALGTSSTAHNNSIAIGTKATAVSSQNLAIGWEAHIGNIKTDDEKIKNAIALGSDSQVRVNDLLESDHDRGVLSIGDTKKERRIIHVRAGVNDTDAVNVSQLKSVQSGLTDMGLTFVTNDGERTAKLGSKVTIQGTAKKDGHEYTADNLTTEIDGSGNITILMDKNISADKIAVNGKDGKDAVSIAGKDGVGHIGLTGPAGTNGMNGADGKPGTSLDITVKNGYDDTAKGINGTNGVDGKDGITRIVYTDKTGEHQVATLEDGLKFKGDAGTEIAKKLNNTLEIVGGVTDSTKLTDGNIGVVSENGKLNVRLAKDLTGLNSTTYTTKTGEGESETTSTTVVNGNGLTIKDGPSITNNGIDGGKKTITNVGSGIKAGTDGKYTVTDANKSNAANIGDVNNMVNQAVGKLTEDTKNDLAGKANVDATNVGANISGSDEQKKTNEKAWASAIGTGNINAPEGMLITDTAVHNEVRPKENGNYVKKDKTTGENLSALDSKIGKLDETKKYNYIDSGKDVSISDNLTKLDTQVKNNADAISKEKQDRENAITNITNNIGNLSDSAVKYDAGTNKGKVTLAGADGTTITNLKAGEVAEKSKDAVNGSQLYAEQKARTDADNKLTSDLAAETQARTAADTAINNKIGSLDANGNYIKKDDSISKNLSALDTGLKTTSDLIHTNGDTIQIGGSSTATKIDVSGKDANGNTTGRVITGVVTDDGDPTSAANVGYVNGVTAANTQQIYRDMNNAYGRLNNNINKAAAGSNALAALHPLDYDPDDKADFAVGYGHYRNANAAAVGAFYHPNENTMVNVGVSLGNGDPGFNAGVSFKIGSGSAGRQAMSKTEMAKVINSQSKEIDALKKDNADKDKRIDALEQKMAEILAKLDKNGK